MTHRQFKVWLAWEDIDWWAPTLVTKYLQLNVTESRRSWVATPNEVQMKDFELVPGDTVEPEEAPAPTGILGRHTGRMIHRVVDKDGNVLSETMVTV